jgi:hypothetical protein
MKVIPSTILHNALRLPKTWQRALLRLREGALPGWPRGFGHRGDVPRDFIPLHVAERMEAAGLVSLSVVPRPRMALTRQGRTYASELASRVSADDGPNGAPAPQ